MKTADASMFAFSFSGYGDVYGITLPDGKPGLLASGLAGLCGASSAFCPYYHLTDAMVAPDSRSEICIGTAFGPIREQVITTPDGLRGMAGSFSYNSTHDASRIHKWLDDVVIPAMWPGLALDFSDGQKLHPGGLDGRFVPAMDTVIHSMELCSAWRAYKKRCHCNNTTADVDSFAHKNQISKTELQKARYDCSRYEADGWCMDKLVEMTENWYAAWTTGLRNRDGQSRPYIQSSAKAVTSAGHSREK